MSSNACHMSVVQYNDLICTKDGTDPLGNDYGSCVLGVLLQCLSQLTVSLKVKGREAVIKDKDFRILCNGSGNGQTLFLSARNIGTSL